MAAERKAANAMGGMTARACDGCLKRRARWFCASDYAFLCQSCDASVHSANKLASRHERVRLESASSKPTPKSDTISAPKPAWHQGFTRKPRTPRHNKVQQQHKKHQERLSSINSISTPVDPLVPELGSEEGSIEETEEQMLCRVPEFDPFSATENEDGNNLLLIDGFDDLHQDGTCELDSLNEFLPSDMDLAEFVADVESLLVGDEEVICDVKESKHHAPQNVEVRVKEEGLDSVMNWNLDLPFDSGEEEKAAVSTEINTSGEIRNNIFLRLNYEEVISAWANQGNSPWTTGSKPIYFNPNDGWPDFQEMYNKDNHTMGYGHIRGSGGEREARVSRYREKRRTRLFSKKIRYEVRKLNAEKRPRMKGRFVKRTSFVGTSSSSSSSGTAFPYITNNNGHQLPIN